jgi:NAD(P)-dependent dehydrogenase (short-subunit alcohol dehydrogenase family)
VTDSPRDYDGQAPGLGLRDQVALVTGGGSGIGSAICTVFAEAGAAVAVADTKAGSANAVAASLRASTSGCDSLPLHIDVSDPDDVANAVAATSQRFGRIDILVNNAAINPVARFSETSIATWRRVFAVNVEGPWLMIQAVSPIMRSQSPQPDSECRGKIINISSAAAEVGRPLFSAYGASKAALNHLSRTCALVLAPEGISTTTLYPGDVADGMWSVLPTQIGSLEGTQSSEVVRARLEGSPLGRFQTAREVAEMALFVATRSDMSLNGTVLWTTPHTAAL